MTLKFCKSFSPEKMFSLKKSLQLEKATECQHLKRYYFIFNFDFYKMDFVFITKISVKKYSKNTVREQQCKKKRENEKYGYVSLNNLVQFTVILYNHIKSL